MAISRGWSSTGMDKRGVDCRPPKYGSASSALWVQASTQAGHFALQSCISVSPLLHGVMQMSFLGPVTCAKG